MQMSTISVRLGNSWCPLRTRPVWGALTLRVNLFSHQTQDGLGILVGLTLTGCTRVLPIVSQLLRTSHVTDCVSAEEDTVPFPVKIHFHFGQEFQNQNCLEAVGKQNPRIDDRSTSTSHHGPDATHWIQYSQLEGRTTFGIQVCDVGLLAVDTEICTNEALAKWLRLWGNSLN